MKRIPGSKALRIAVGSAGVLAVAEESGEPGLQPVIVPSFLNVPARLDSTSVLVVMAVLTVATAASAGDERRYLNARFDYAITIPAGFGLLKEPANGDGGTSRSRLGHAELAVWGSNILEGDFKDEAIARRNSAEAEGWQIVYSRSASDFAAYSGTRNGRIVYQRGMPGCEGQAVFYQIEYDAEAKATMDPVIKKMTRSFKRTEGCNP